MWCLCGGFFLFYSTLLSCLADVVCTLHYRFLESLGFFEKYKKNKKETKFSNNPPPKTINFPHFWRHIWVEMGKLYGTLQFGRERSKFNTYFWYNESILHIPASVVGNPLFLVHCGTDERGQNATLISYKMNSPRQSILHMDYEKPIVHCRTEERAWMSLLSRG